MKKINKHNKLDMGWGNPSFLAPYWQTNKINIDNVKRSKNYQYGSRKKLKRLIKEIHKKIGNAETKNKHIVVAGGASQILLGLMSVLKQNRDEVNYAWANPPHFSRFPSLADLAKLKWIHDNKSIIITSNPNNPDSSITDSIDQNGILDLCYNWPQYTDIKKYDHPIMVFSLSKATGHASTRIGWAIIKDKKIAKALEQYIEISTGGISIESQLVCEKILSHQLKTDKTVFEYGKKILKKRWEEINKFSNLNTFQIINNSGMFLWANGVCPPSLMGLNGSSLRTSNDFFRLNIGCNKKTFKYFLQILHSINKKVKVE